MSYLRKVLLPGEQVIYETGLHWLVFGWAILVLLAALGLAIGALFVSGGEGPILLMTAGAVAAVGLVLLLAAALRRASTELAVTDQRVVFKRGLIARHTIEMNRSKVESVDVDQSLLGRILGYGTVQLRGTGGSLEPMAMIGSPLAFRSHITADPMPRPGQDRGGAAR
ncbi:MAG TPA: PH domain-containing protein [Stellaceae bacterium]|nr:PH domain-containing protein [Stellaceae bacterium]